MVKRFFFAVLLTVLTMLASAQAVKEVTLIVSGNGANKTEAINVALRSAIEQTFGTFVSANTTILNDELVKDEIATISSGNIRKFKELGSYTLPSGNIIVSLEATVSIGKLVSYARSKGSECEFSGETLVANHKLLELRYQNAKIALLNLLKYIEKAGPTAYDYKLSVGEPEIDKNGAVIKMEVNLKRNKNTSVFWENVVSVLKTTRFTYKECREVGEDGYQFGGDIYYYDNYYYHQEIYHGLGAFYYPIKMSEYGSYSKYTSETFVDIFRLNVFLRFEIKDNNGKKINVPEICVPYSYFYENLLAGGRVGATIEFTVKIPLEDVNTISKFIIEPKKDIVERVSKQGQCIYFQN